MSRNTSSTLVGTKEGKQVEVQEFNGSLTLELT
jgi:hypothetical protein